MAMVYNDPTYSFIVEAYNDSFEVICRFRIDQVVRNVNRSSEVERAHNLVERQLDHHHKRTGLHYGAIATGPREEMDQFLKSYNLKLD